MASECGHARTQGDICDVLSVAGKTVLSWGILLCLITDNSTKLLIIRLDIEGNKQTDNNKKNNKTQKQTIK